jgi:diguanylate cyclase (GGDEF)-like protein
MSDARRQSNTKQARSGDDDQRGLLFAQLRENAAVARESILGNLVNAVLCGAVMKYYDAFDLTLAMVFGSVIVALLSWRIVLTRDVRAATVTDPRLKRWKTETELMAATLGLCWGFASFSFLATGISEIHMIGAMVGSGMMSAGALSFRTCKRAALFYVICCAAVCAGGLIYIGSAASYMGLVLLLCYFAVLRTNIAANARRFDYAYKANHQLTESTETIQLLLNDVTEQGLDWLVEADGYGRLVNPCARMQDAAAKSADELTGLPITHLLDEGPARNELKAQFMTGAIIRRHVVSLTVNGEKRWWSISARPSPSGKIAYRGVFTDITAQRAAEEQVSFLAHYDGLTTLPNRFLFNQSLTHALRREKGEVAIMYMDLDHFKNVNDTLGHPVGDLVLKEAAQRIENALGQYDLAGRLGGDEFAVMVTGARIAQAEQIAERIVSAFQQPIRVDNHDVVIGASIGIAVGPEDGDSAESLLRRADLALYAAKGEGRNRVYRFSAEMDEAAQLRRSIETDLRDALNRGELCLHYQPLVDVKTGRVSGFEALIRWNHPTRGLIMPGSFIPIAEETGLIVAIGDWVIRQALADAVHWPDDIGISINLSPSQMRNTAIFGTLLQAASNSGIAVDRVCIEITESVLMQDTAANLTTLHRMQSFGMQISLDDFGTGYSSLSYLRSFPFSKIKIDRSFVQDIDRREDCRAIVRSIVTLADSLGMTTIAEGVERPQQAELLADEGCDVLQGFLYSAAIPGEQVPGYIASRNGTDTARQAA